jgi:hypothetical protein
MMPIYVLVFIAFVIATSEYFTVVGQDPPEGHRRMSYHSQHHHPHHSHHSYHATQRGFFVQIGDGIAGIGHQLAQNTHKLQDGRLFNNGCLGMRVPCLYACA